MSLACITVGYHVYVDDNTQSIYNSTRFLEWEDMEYINISQEASGNINFSKISSYRIQNMIKITVNGLGRLSFEAANLGIEYGYNHPDIMYWLTVRVLPYLTWLVVFSLFIPAIPLLLALVYLLYDWIRKKIKARKSVKE